MTRVKLCPICRVGNCRDCSKCRQCGCQCTGEVSTNVVIDNRRQSTISYVEPDESEFIEGASDSNFSKKKDFTRIDTIQQLLISCGGNLNELNHVPSLTLRQTDKNVNKTDAKGFQALTRILSVFLEHAARVAYPANPDLLIESAWQKRNKSNFEEEYKRCLNSLVTVENKFQAGSVERRVARALLVESIRPCDLARLRANNAINFDRGYATVNASLDFERLGLGIPLVREIVDRKLTFMESDVHACVDSILSPQNVATLSWGTRNVSLGPHEKVELPRLMRRTSRIQLFHLYRAPFVEKGLQPPVRMTTFYKIANHITSSDDRLITAIDYVSAILVSDQIEILQKIVNYFAQKSTSALSESGASLTRKLEVTQNFLKHSANNHCGRDCQCTTHDIAFALGSPLQEAQQKNNSCHICNYPNFAVDRLRTFVSEAYEESNSTTRTIHKATYEDAINVINVAENKFELYRAHQMRVAQKQTALDLILEDMKKWCLENKRDSIHCICIIGWKTKYLKMSSRKSSFEFNRQRGLGWHGCTIVYYAYRDGSAHLVRLYIDQILQDGNKQDAVATVSMIEGGLHWLHQQVPHLKYATLVSDNAAWYHSRTLLLLLQVLNTKQDIKIIRYLKTEAQNWKSMLDSHFSISMAHIKRYMRTSCAIQIKTIATPKALVTALTWNGGVRNSMVMLANVNRAKVEEMGKILKISIEQLKLCFNRCDDIHFLNYDEGDAIISIESLESYNRPFKFRAHYYANERVVFTVKPHEKQLEYEIDGVMYTQGSRVEGETPFAPKRRKLESETKEVRRNPERSRGSSGVPEIAEADDSDDEYETYARKETSRDFAMDGDALSELEIEEALVYDDNDSDSDSGDSEKQAPKSAKVIESVYFGDGDMNKGKNMMTGVDVVKLSYFGDIVDTKQPATIANNSESGESNNNSFRRQDMVAVAVRYAAKMVLDDSKIVVRDGRSDDIPDYNDAKGFQISTVRSQGWARGPKHGQMYGHSFLCKDFKTTIDEFFAIGEADFSQKTSASRILEKIQGEDTVTKFSYPGVNEIQLYIRSNKAKKSEESNKISAQNDEALNENEENEENDGPMNAKSSRVSYPPELDRIMHSYLAADSKMKPKEALAKLKSECNELILKIPNVADDKIKSHFSQIKRMYTMGIVAIDSQL